ncbi:solute carrier family 66 member 2-like isoform X2 [Oscarella lobularis]|uniref:solute carrier family 66 member 2-like isoform X2 n=1 Tax=Oscarella lobularis TaxID=121494 RepID=UPI0033131190
MAAAAESDSFFSSSSYVGLIVSWTASGAMIFGGVVPFIPQYQQIRRLRNAEGFSTFVCFVLLIANILRILFWFGTYYELPLLAQSVIMIATMIVLLKLCVQVRHESSSPSYKRTSSFTDFDLNDFWNWGHINDYLMFLAIFTGTLAFVTFLFVNNSLYVEFLGFASLLMEASLGLPQFLKNFSNKSTQGMNISMPLCWTVGDLFKTGYFLARQAPKQFWICGSIQK